MSELISGKEALIALANGKDVQYRIAINNLNKWQNNTATYSAEEIMSGETAETDDLCSMPIEFRLKPRTITINGVEVPAPFKPKSGDMVWCLNELSKNGYEARTAYDSDDFTPLIAYWHTEEEIKQVISALRSIFNAP